MQVVAVEAVTVLVQEEQEPAVAVMEAIHPQRVQPIPEAAAEDSLTIPTLTPPAMVDPEWSSCAMLAVPVPQAEP